MTKSDLGINEEIVSSRLEEALRDTELRYRTIFETTAVSIWEEDFSAVKAALDDLKTQSVTNLKQYLDDHPKFVQKAAQMIKVVDVNKATLRMLGAENKDELLGALDKVFVLETMDILKDEMIAISEGRTYFEGETINRTLQGKEINILLSMTIPSEEAKYDSVLVSMMDITRRKHAEQIMLALNRATMAMEGVYTEEDIFSSVAEELKLLGFHSMIFLLNESRDALNITHLSFENETLRIAEKLVNIRHEDFSIPLDQSEPYQDVVRDRKTVFVLDQSKLLAQVLPKPMRKFAGQIIKILKVSSLIISPLIVGDVVIGVFAVSSDNLRESNRSPMAAFASQVAAGLRKAQLFEQLQQELRERKQAEKELGQSQERYRESQHMLQNVLDTIPVGVFWKDRDSVYLGCNRLFAQDRGLDTPDEVIGVDDFKLSPKGQAEMYRADDRAVIQSGVAKLNYEEPQTWSDGTQHWLRTSKIPLRDWDESIIGILCTYEDITDRKQAEKELEQKTAELTRLYRASGALLASTTPDLNDLAQTIVETVLFEFEHSNCSLLLVQPETHTLNRIAVTGPYADEVILGELSIDGSGLVPQAIRSGKIVNVPDVTASPDYLPNWKAARSELVIPLKLDQLAIGAIDLQSAELGSFSADDERLLSLFAERAALALENTRLFDQAERRLKNLQALHNVDVAITGSLDIRITLNILLDQVFTQLGVDAANVLLLEPHLQTLEFAAGKGFRTNALQHTILRIGEGHAGQAVLERRPIHIPDLRRVKTEFLRSPQLSSEDFISYFGVPLIVKGQVKGVLEIFHRTRLDPDPEWFDFLSTLAGQAAVAIDNATLFDGMQKANLELNMAYTTTLEGWARALELRDMETEGHSKRVVDLTIQLSREMGIRENELINVRRGALLHDIGKMGIPDSILQKPGPLTDEEWQVMHRHPTFAFEMLSPISYLRQALDIPHSHHERWDGTGYPQGLKERQIPLAARIFAIVDVWDALRSDRPYRKAWSEEKALRHIKEQAGKYFDPQVVEAFLTLISNKAIAP